MLPLVANWLPPIWKRWGESWRPHRIKDPRSLLPNPPTSLNSWIWACSNMEKTLELAPSILFLAFLGACRGSGMHQQLCSFLWCGI